MAISCYIILRFSHEFVFGNVVLHTVFNGWCPDWLKFQLQRHFPVVAATAATVFDAVEEVTAWRSARILKLGFMWRICRRHRQDGSN